MKPREDWQHAGFGVYIHWPFCASKCPYCDFNSHVRSAVDKDAWQSSFLKAIAAAVVERPDRRVDTVFFGGGTPSLMAPETVGAILDAIALGWTVDPDAEITLEANPTSVEAGRLRAYRDAGVNRVSMGIQALRDDHLRALGRTHSVAEGRAAFDLARATFDRVSLDLIHSRQHLDIDAWRAELTEALAMASDHLSLYQLTIEDGTAFGDRAARGRLPGLPEPDLAAEMYAMTEDLCAAAGFEGYEISNYARPGSESRHNLIYWRGGDYAGVGPGAHGRLTCGGQRVAVEDARSPEAWMERVSAVGHGRSLSETVDSRSHALEYLMMSLRLREGCDLNRLLRLSGDGVLDTAAVENLVEEGLLARTTTGIAATRHGRPVLDAILRTIIL